ncbi:MAG TPA: mannosyltransferase family protein [Solirubrobacteraceae bacterium]|nr:mannosyltransferase family protein [Solirubrobacteraceae bacterium]
MDSAADARELSADTRAAVRVAWRALWTSRLVIMAAGILAVLEIGRAAGTAGYDPDNLTAPFGYFGNLLVSPLARWDSWWYLTIAHQGYDHNLMRTAFFPLYPMIVGGLGEIVPSDLIAGVIVSVASFGVALVLLYRLAALEFGSASRARLAVMLTAFCPLAFFFSAVYSESLFLALSLGAVFEARMGRWATAGLLGALGAAERNSGVVLVVPLVLLFLYGPRADRPPAPGPGGGWRRLLPRYRIEPQIAWIALVPIGLLAYFVYLALAVGDGLAPLHAQTLWFHHFAGPFGGVWDGAVAAWDGVRQLIHGSPLPVYFTPAGGDPFTVAGLNLMLFAFLILGVCAIIGTLRRLPIAYGAYVLAALALPLSDPVKPQPLASLPRYEIVLFPLFMWAAAWLEDRGWGDNGVAGSAVLLGLFTAMFATWRFVS